MRRIETLLSTSIGSSNTFQFCLFWILNKYQKILQIKILLGNSLKRIGKNNHLIIIVLWYF